MRFSVDAHAIGRHLTGNEVYVRNLLDGLASLDGTAEFIAYLSIHDDDAIIPGRFIRRRVSPNPFIRLGWDLPRRLKQDRPDLIHVQYTAPLACPVPVVVSVHDVSFHDHPEFFPVPRWLQLRRTVARTVRQAVRILAPSEFSRRSIARVYGMDDGNIVTVPNAVSSSFRPLAREAAAAWVEARFSIPAPFILTVGDLQPRKNQIGLIRAFESVIRARPQLRHHLVLAGKDTWYADRVRKAAAATLTSGRVHFTGWVSDEELLQLYAACDVFAFPSFYEGFGLPILEAMACGRAVACSNTSAMPEVADAAALLFDPHSVEEIGRALADLLLDAELRARMERLGLHRAAQYSWQNTARRTLAVYHGVAERRAGAASEASRSVSAIPR